MNVLVETFGRFVTTSMMLVELAYELRSHVFFDKTSWDLKESILDQFPFSVG